MIDLELFKKVVAKEFAAKEDSEIELFAAEAELEVSESYFGKFYPRVVCLITAHLMKVSEISQSSNGSTGELKKIKVGDLEREYAVNSGMEMSKDTLGLTLYGKEYLRLRKKLVKTPLFIS